MEFSVDVICSYHRIKHVANRLGISIASLTGLLRKLGHHAEANKDGYLTPDQIESLEVYYTESFRRTAERSKIKVIKGEIDAFSYLKLFYNLLKLPSSRVIDLSDFESWEINDEKVREAFYRIIYSDRIRSGKGSQFFTTVIRYIISKITASHIDFRLGLLTKISPTLFFRYQGEDEDTAKADQNFGFSVVKYLFTLKAFVTKLFSQTKSYFSYEKNTFKTTYRGMRFI